MSREKITPAIKEERRTVFYEQMINGLGIKAVDKSLAIDLINQSFTQFDSDGFPQNGLNRFLLKSLLDENKIPNQVNVYTREELAARNKAGTIRGRLKQQAQEIGIPLESYAPLLQQANRAIQAYINYGPFYGREKSPTFRVAAEPLVLPKTIQSQLEILGQDLSLLSQSIKQLDPNFRGWLNPETLVTDEPTWRADLILDTDYQLWLNEIQVADGADALMCAEQMAYGLSPAINQTSAAFLAAALLEKFPDGANLGYAAETFDETKDPYASNLKRMSEFLEEITFGKVNFKLLSYPRILRSRNPFSNLNGVILDGYCGIPQLLEKGLEPEQVISCGDQSFLGNKGLLALLFDRRLTNFWKKQLGLEALQNLQSMIPVTDFIFDKADFESSLANNSCVVKTYQDTHFLSLSAMKGIFGQWDKPEDKKRADNLWQDRCRFIKQQFVNPKQFSILVAANGGRSLAWQTGPNRICAKYVKGRLTAVEATIGNAKPDNLKSKIVPAGRDCCFTPVIFN